MIIWQVEDDTTGQRGEGGPMGDPYWFCFVTAPSESEAIIIANTQELLERSAVVAFPIATGIIEFSERFAGRLIELNRAEAIDPTLDPNRIEKRWAERAVARAQEFNFCTGKEAFHWFEPLDILDMYGLEPDTELLAA